jgi:hypothetical protein
MGECEFFLPSNFIILTRYNLSGGVRGIVELLVLQAIENNISGSSQASRIPIQNFFDLIVGTRCVFHSLP